MSPSPTDGPPRDNVRGSGWLIADMSLNIWALSIVKANGLDFVAAQLVFLRAITGICLISPWIWHARARFRTVSDPGFHALRVVLSATALTASFYVIARIPFALFTAANFTRPIVTMLLAAVFLREVIGARRWAAAGVAFIGILIAVEPIDAQGASGLFALPVVILAGCGAIIVTRRLRAAPTVVLMTFYTAGLAVCTAPFAVAFWQPIPADTLLILLGIGVFSQIAQLCFLRAQFWGEAGVLSVVSYLSLVLSTTVGYVVFAETPRPAFFLGAALVIGSVAAIGIRRPSWKSRA